MILNLFAGPGGWCAGLRSIAPDLESVGIEWDAAACATRRAAGHLTIRADVRAYPTAPFIGKVTGLIASPPCPTFSAAGSGEGLDEMPELTRVARILNLEWQDPRTMHLWSDERTPLVLEPLRWVKALRPEWVACEQVRGVLPLWQEYARFWRGASYSTWAGVLNTADFGVPQTRERAFLLASRVGFAHPPEPTHCKGGAQTMFGTLAPWVSMADALGWGAVERPCVTVTGGGTRAGGAEPLAHPERFRERERESWVSKNTGRRDA